MLHVDAAYDSLLGNALTSIFMSAQKRSDKQLGERQSASSGVGNSNKMTSREHVEITCTPQITAAAPAPRLIPQIGLDIPFSVWPRLLPEAGWRSVAILQETRSYTTLQPPLQPRIHRSCFCASAETANTRSPLRQP